MILINIFESVVLETRLKHVMIGTIVKDLTYGDVWQ